MSDQALVISKPKDMLEYLQKSKASITMALPAHLNPDRMLRLALTCFSTNQKIRECTANSIVASIVVASQLGLEPGVAGQGYLVPYGRTCTFIPGWQGLVGLLNNTGRATAWTGAVFEGDEWDFELGSSPKCRHKPGKNYGDPEKLIWVYACGKVNGSEQPVVEAWPIHRVWKHRDQFNKVGGKHYSYTNKEMYARKVVLLQVLKYMPRSIELNNAIIASEAAEMGRTTRVEQGVTRDEGVIIDLDPETDEKFSTKPAGGSGKPAEGDHPPGLEPRTDKPAETTADDENAEMAKEIEENRLKAETEAKAKADAEAAAKKPAETTTPSTAAASAGTARSAKPKAPDWVSERDKPALLAKLSRASLTQAQLCGWFKEKFSALANCKTVDEVEAFGSTKTLANALFKFDAIKAEIAAQPGKSAV